MLARVSALLAAVLATMATVFFVFVAVRNAFATASAFVLTAEIKASAFIILIAPARPVIEATTGITFAAISPSGPGIPIAALVKADTANPAPTIFPDQSEILDVAFAIVFPKASAL